MEQIQLQEITSLPLEVLIIPTRTTSDIVITTPHRGKVVLKLKETHTPFIFGSTTQTDKQSEDIIREIKGVEREAIDFLLNQWKETLPESSKVE